MKTITKTIYQYNELNDTAKGCAKNYYNENLFASELVTEQLEQDLHSVGKEDYEYCFPDAELSWSLSCCQGDGVSFTGKWQGKECLPFIEKAYGGNIPSRIRRIIPYIEVELQSISHHYCHAYTVETCVDLITKYYDDYPHVAKLLDKMREVVDAYRIVVCRKLEKDGYTLIEEQTSDEYLADFFNGNDYYFNQDGTIERE